MSDITITFAIVIGIVVMFMWDVVPVVLVSLGTALALYFTGVTSLQESLGGLGDPAVIFIASLFVVSAGLERTGVTAWAGQHLIARAGESRTRLLVLMMSLCAVLTALISVNGAVAALLPVVVVMAVRLEARAIAIADATGFRRACRFTAGANRHAGQSTGVRGSTGSRISAIRSFLVRPRRRSASRRLHRHRGFLRPALVTKP